MTTNDYTLLPLHAIICIIDFSMEAYEETDIA
jgi:hypothetical protein